MVLSDYALWRVRERENYQSITYAILHFGEVLCFKMCPCRSHMRNDNSMIAGRNVVDATRWMLIFFFQFLPFSIAQFCDLIESFFFFVSSVFEYFLGSSTLKVTVETNDEPLEVIRATIRKKKLYDWLQFFCLIDALLRASENFILKRFFFE